MPYYDQVFLPFAHSPNNIRPNEPRPYAATNMKGFEMDLSIVTTMYRSAPYLAEFHSRASAAAQRITDDYEIIFVNDGSPDDSLEVALGLYEQDERVRVVDLSKNFGHHKAMMTGLAHARGKLVFLLDSDLEEEPELLEKFHTEMLVSGADVVYGVQATRKGNSFEKFSGMIFYKLFNMLSPEPIPRNVITLRLMTQRYVAALLQHQEREIVIAGLWVATGFKQQPSIVHKRSKGSSTYNLGRKFTILVNSVTSFSNRPLVSIFYLGCIISFVACIAAFDLIVRRIFFGALLEGWASLIVSLWLLGGIIIFCLGIIGIYLSKIFVETKQRPYTIVRHSYERAQNYEPVADEMVTNVARH
jgi:putative glycosyltransferase